MYVKPFLRHLSPKITEQKFSENEQYYLLIFRKIQRIHNFGFSQNAVPHEFHLNIGSFVLDLRHKIFLFLLARFIFLFALVSNNCFIYIHSKFSFSDHYMNLNFIILHTCICICKFCIYCINGYKWINT